MNYVLPVIGLTSRFTRHLYVCWRTVERKSWWYKLLVPHVLNF